MWPVCLLDTEAENVPFLVVNIGKNSYMYEGRRVSYEHDFYNCFANRFDSLSFFAGCSAITTAPDTYCRATIKNIYTSLDSNTKCFQTETGKEFCTASGQPAFKELAEGEYMIIIQHQYQANQPAERCCDEYLLYNGCTENIGVSTIS